MNDRRRFERVTLPEFAKVYVTDEQGCRVGMVRVLGRGGMLIAANRDFEEGSEAKLFLLDESEGIRREVHVVVRYQRTEGLGVEFVELEPDAAVEVGVIIGKYYAAGANV